MPSPLGVGNWVNRADIGAATAWENLEELVALRDLAERRFGTGLISVEGDLIAAVRTNETRVFLEPTERLRECYAALRAGQGQ